MKFTTLDLLLNIVLMFLFEAEVLQDVATFSSFFFFWLDLYLSLSTEHQEDQYCKLMSVLSVRLFILNIMVLVKLMVCFILRYFLSPFFILHPVFSKFYASFTHTIFAEAVC